MKVTCINNIELSRDSNGKPRHKRLSLTIGKVYDTVVEHKIRVDNVTFYMIEKDEDDESRLYAAQYFVTLDVWREQQLNRIL
jgi:hypothetical protein